METGLNASSEFDSELKAAKQRIRQGQPYSALFFLSRASEWTTTPAGKHTHKKGILLHRKAVIEAIYGDPDDARRLFKLALEKIPRSAPVTRAILLRDFGNFELLQGKRRVASQKIGEALLLLSAIENRDERTQTELIVTIGFMARTEIGTKQHKAAVKKLRDVAGELRGYKKVDYELANLSWLIDALRPGIERQTLILRAILLSLKIGHHQRAVEFTTLLGGKPLRGAYRFIF